MGDRYKNLRPRLFKALDNLLSVKAGVFIVSALFLWRAKITETSYVQIVAIVIGTRAANEIVALMKRGKDE